MKTATLPHPILSSDPTASTDPTFLGYSGDLAADLLHDMRALLGYFQLSRRRFIGEFGLPALNLRLSPQALCNCGVLSPASLGRFDQGYRPAGALLTELPNAN